MWRWPSYSRRGLTRASSSGTSCYSAPWWMPQSWAAEHRHQAPSLWGKLRTVISADIGGNWKLSVPLGCAEGPQQPRRLVTWLHNWVVAFAHLWAQGYWPPFNSCLPWMCCWFGEICPIYCRLYLDLVLKILKRFLTIQLSPCSLYGLEFGWFLLSVCQSWLPTLLSRLLLLGLDFELAICELLLKLAVRVGSLIWSREEIQQ